MLLSLSIGSNDVMVCFSDLYVVVTYCPSHKAVIDLTLLREYTAFQVYNV